MRAETIGHQYVPARDAYQQLHTQVLNPDGQFTMLTLQRAIIALHDQGVPETAMLHVSGPCLYASWTEPA